jgi:pimeloyl-ACP methyl ester carboxylesterase
MNSDPVVFLPGMMCDARLFAPQIADLSRDTAVTVAPITCGERIEEIASHLLDLLPARFALAGLSMGGIVAMELLRRAPERITKLALMDTNPLAETPQSAAGYEPFVAKLRAGLIPEAVAMVLGGDVLAPGPARAEVLAVPTLILCGAEDRLTPPRRHAFMAGLMPNARLVTVEGAGHLPVLEQPQTVIAALRGWLAQPLVLQKPIRA